MDILRCLVSLYLLTVLVDAMSELSEECDFMSAVPRLNSCVSRWDYYNREHNGHLAYLTDNHLTKQICQRGSLDSADLCVQDQVSPHCGTVRRYWKGQRDLFYYICNQYYEFAERHRKCVTNHKLVHQLERCITESHTRINAKVEFCESSDLFLRCAAESLGSMCDKEATKFYWRMFRAEMAPEMTYRECPEVSVVILSPEPAPDPCRLDGPCDDRERGGRMEEVVGGDQGTGYMALSRSAADTRKAGTITVASLTLLVVLLLNFR